MTFRAWVAVGAAGLVLAACGSDAQPAAESATTVAPSTAAATTTAPETTTAAPTTPKPTPKPKPKPAPPPRQATSAQLRSALLTQRDLPAGFTLGPDPATDGPHPTSRSCSPACAKAVNALYNELPPARAAVRYIRDYPTGRQQVRTVLEELGSWPGNGAAQEMEAFGKTPARCPTWSFFDNQYGVVPTTATPLTISKIAEQVIAYTFVTHWNGRGDTHDIMIFARSDTRRLLFEYSVPVGRAIDWAECYKILGAALRKLPAWHH